MQNELSMKSGLSTWQVIKVISSPGFFLPSGTENRIAYFCQLLLMVCLMCLSMSGANLQQQLQRNMTQLLGADLVISDSSAISATNAEKLEKLQQAATAHTFSRLHNITLTHKGKWQSVQLKVVDNHYPLSGHLIIGRQLGDGAIAYEHGPKNDELWVDSRLFSSLGLTMGQSLNIGDIPLQVTGLIEHEPDRLLEGHSVAMRAMVSHNSLLAKHLQNELQNQTMQYRYGFNFDKLSRAHFIDWAEQHFEGSQVLHQGSGHPLAAFWQRVENFLGLIMVSLLLMATITLHHTGKRRIHAEQYRFGLLLSMGVKSNQLLIGAVVDWFLGFLCLLLPASLLALAGQFVFLQAMAEHFVDLHINAFLFDSMIWFKSVMLVMILLLIFQLPVWFAVWRMVPAQLLRQAKINYSGWLSLLAAASGILLLAMTYSDNPVLTLMTLGGLLGAVLVMLGVSWLVMYSGEKLAHRVNGLLSFSLYLLKQRFVSKASEIIGLGLSLTLMLFCLVLMQDFGSMMSKYTRENDGNLLVTQANSEQVSRLTAWSEKNQAEIRQLKPFYRAKVVRVNGQRLAQYIQYPSDTSAVLQRPVRLHFTDTLPANNQLVSGQWWGQSREENLREKGLSWQKISVEQEVMSDLSLSLGDKLSLGFGQREIEFTIVASHQYQSGAGSITFWFQVPEHIKTQLDIEPLYMGSLELNDAAWEKLTALWQTLPTLKMQSLREITARFDSTLSLLTRMLTLFSSLILMMTMLVAASSVQSHLSQDKLKNGLLLSFGKTKLDCIKLTVIDWLITGIITAAGAFGGTFIIGNLMYQSQFSLTYQPDYFWLSVVLCMNLLFIVLLGLGLNRYGLRVSVKDLLHEQ